jgi:hypothetical protein
VVVRCIDVVALMPPMHDASEKLFQDNVKRIARMAGWQIFHATPKQVRPGVMVSDGPGFPDLVLVSTIGRGIIYAELKTEQGRLSPIQKQWGQNILANGGEYYVWRPSQLELIAERLGRTAP